MKRGSVKFFEILKMSIFHKKYQPLPRFHVSFPGFKFWTSAQNFPEIRSPNFENFYLTVQKSFWHVLGVFGNLYMSTFIINFLIIFQHHFEHKIWPFSWLIWEIAYRQNFARVPLLWSYSSENFSEASSSSVFRNKAYFDHKNMEIKLL